MTQFQSINQIGNDPYIYPQQWKKQTSHQIIGFFCSYTPEEIIHAAGALPFRIFGSEISIVQAGAHLQAYCCSLARGGLEEALSGKLSFLDGTVFPHTCDTMQRLSDIWRLNAGFLLHFDVVLPASLNSASAFQYMVDIFYKFKSDLEQALGIKITDEKLKKSIRLYNQIRRALQEIYWLKSHNPAIISGSDVYAIMKTAMIMDRQELFNLLADLLADLKKEISTVRQRHKKRIMLTGGVCNHPNIYKILEDAGGVVVWDDLCTGSRFFNGQIDENATPVEAIAKRYFGRVICPTKHFNITCRGENLVRLAREHQADGVIFLLLKFCDPHAFDYPYLKRYLDGEGIPNMLIEVEQQVLAVGQLRTRLEAFIEML